ARRATRAAASAWGAAGAALVAVRHSFLGLAFALPFTLPLALALFFFVDAGWRVVPLLGRLAGGGAELYFLFAQKHPRVQHHLIPFCESLFDFDHLLVAGADDDVTQVPAVRRLHEALPILAGGGGP